MAGIIERIGKLLSKAESTESEAESHALFAKAQQLSTEHSIDLTMARHRHKAAEKDELESRTWTIGAARTAGLVEKVRLFEAVAGNNDLEWALRKNSTEVYPMGFASDLDVVEKLFRSLEAQMQRFADEWIASREWVGDTYGNYWDPKPVNARVARRLFNEGFVDEIRSRLHQAKVAAQQEAEERYADQEQGTGASHGKEVSSLALALKDKSEQVDEFKERYYRRHQVRGTWRGSSAASGYGSRSRDAGIDAGTQASLSGAAELDDVA